MAVILVTHDLGVVANMAESVVVMNKGRIMESGPAPAVLGAPAHGYTKKLFAAAPSIPQIAEPARTEVGSDHILELRSVCKTYTMRAGGWSKPRTITACHEVMKGIVTSARVIRLWKFIGQY